LLRFSTRIVFEINTPGVIASFAECPCTCFSFSDFQRAHVGLIISPIMSIRMIREIEIYWNHARYRPGDTIALYTSEPTNGLEPIYTLIPNAPSGIKRTGLQATFVPTSNLTFVQQCLRTYATYIHRNYVIPI